tara:strand:+ start:10112 stop:11329 length:1218 start_codon:yes stop_codon:yes gene_type:complete
MNKCISCNSKKLYSIYNFGNLPLSNEFVKKKKNKKIKKYKLNILVCEKCFLVQNENIVKENLIFNTKYLYHSSYSKLWLDHSKKLSRYLIKRFKIKKNAYVIEIASNDGYLLKNFKKRGIKHLGVEPSKSVNDIAKKNGISTLNSFFGKKILKSRKIKKNPDLIIGLNVLAHTPNLKDFIFTLDKLMTHNSVAVFEIQYALNIFRKLQFDTLYHEHYSYFSVTSILALLKNTKISIFDVQETNTHGGSIRIFLKKKNNITFKENLKIEKIIKKEKKIGMTNMNFYKKFRKELKNLITTNKLFFKKNKSKIIGYGAAAKATIFCNVMKLSDRDIRFIVDKNEFKQNRQIPGTNIDILGTNHLKQNNPEYLLIFPWNLKKEIINDYRYSLKNCKFLTFEPKLKITKK